MTKVLAALLGLALARCAEPVVVVACAGDSITAGGHGAGHDYPALLQDLLGDGYEVHNFGRSGTTVGDGDGFKPWRDSGGYDDMIERALFPDDEEVKEDPYRPIVHGASDIDFDEHGDAVEFGRVSDEGAAGYEV